MVYDFDGDGKAEMCVKTAPGTKTRFAADGTATERDVSGTCTAADYGTLTAIDWTVHFLWRGYGKKYPLRSAQIAI